MCPGMAAKCSAEKYPRICSRMSLSHYLRIVAPFGISDSWWIQWRAQIVVMHLSHSQTAKRQLMLCDRYLCQPNYRLLPNANRFPPNTPTSPRPQIWTQLKHWPSIKRFMFTYNVLSTTTISILHTIFTYNYCTTYFTYLYCYIYIYIWISV